MKTSTRSLIQLTWLAFLLPLQAQDAMKDISQGGSGPSADHAALAKQLSNPVSSLVSVPFQNNFESGMGPEGDGYQWRMNVQPVIPSDLSEDWNLITRVIVPVIHQEDIAGIRGFTSGSQTGLGDTLASFFFSPKEPMNGWIWGAGPVLSLPTGTETLLGSEKWGAGPTFVGLKQTGPWTYGALANHVWSFAGDSSRSEVNNTFMQPFLVYNTPDGETIGLLSESTYNWETSQWTIPVILALSKVVSIGDQKVQFQIGGRWYAEKAPDGPDWGLRLSVTFLFPKS
jgi:hypothetical protein